MRDCELLIKVGESNPATLAPFFYNLCLIKNATTIRSDDYITCSLV